MREGTGQDNEVMNCEFWIRWKIKWGHEVEKVVATTMDKQPKEVVLNLDCTGKSPGELKKQKNQDAPTKSIRISTVETQAAVFIFLFFFKSLPLIPNCSQSWEPWI